MEIKCKIGQMKCVKFLIKQYSNVKKIEDSVMNSAIVGGHVDVVKYLIMKVFITKKIFTKCK